MLSPSSEAIQPVARPCEESLFFEVDGRPPIRLKMIMPVCGMGANPAGVLRVFAPC